MIFVRVCVDASTFAVLAVMEQPRPFIGGGEIQIDGVDSVMIDLGAFEDFAATDATAKAEFIRLRLETHPLAKTHDDAPKVRVRPDVEDLPKLHFSPCTIDGVVEHLEKRRSNALPSAPSAVIKQCFAHTGLMTAKSLRGLGMSFDEIKSLPRFVEAKSAAMTRAMQPKIEAEQSAAAAAREAARQERINKRLAKTTERNP